MYSEQLPDAYYPQRMYELLKKKISNLLGKKYEYLPKIVQSKELLVMQIITRNYILICLLNDELKRKLDNFRRNGYESFPGLIKQVDSEEKCAYEIANEKNVLFHNVKVNNQYSFSLGENSTIILDNYEQKINLDKLGDVSYTIDLCYIISFGDVITKDTIYDFFDELVTYSINYWRSLSYE